LYPFAFLLVLAFAACGRKNPPPASQDSLPPFLERAWAFAGAIRDDAKDRDASQGKVAKAVLDAGLDDEALRLATGMDGWRKGLVLADAAFAKAIHGVPATNLFSLVEEAGLLSASAGDWQRVRIQAHMARAWAAMGQEERLVASRDRFGHDDSERGKLAAYHALAMARNGKVEPALALLQGVAGETHYDVVIDTLRGFLLVAREGKLPPDKVDGLLESAWAYGEKIPGFMRPAFRLEIVGFLVELGRVEEARNKMEEVETELLAVGIPAHVKAPLLAETGKTWGLVGSPGRLDGLLPVIRALEESPDVQNIERPAVLAAVAEALAACGKTAEAGTTFAEAIRQAAALANARPRALAAVEICLALHRSQAAAGAHAADLDRLLASFDEAAN
jgi:predicted small lipoprotein YifL